MRLIDLTTFTGHPCKIDADVAGSLRPYSDGEYANGTMVVSAYGAVLAYVREDIDTVTALVEGRDARKDG